MSKDLSAAGFFTKAVHAGVEPDARTGAVNVPIYASSTFAQDGVGGLREGYEYARTGNPTRAALERSLAILEGGGYGRAFASGMAATDTAIRSILRPGDHMVIPHDAYGGTFRLIDKVFTQWGIEYSVAAMDDVESVTAAFKPNTKLVWIETPTNPLLSIGDIRAISSVAHGLGARVLVDNTFASPYLQQPLALGADVVLHSTTKYLGGHSDVVGGALITNDQGLDENFAFLQNGAGAVPGPFDVFLTLRGIKTLGVRMAQHSASAMQIAQALAAHASVDVVLYPGLDSHPNHDIAKNQMRAFGGMVSFRLKGGKSAALRVCERTRIFTLAESLGGVESLIEYPSAMTHASTSGSLLEVPDDLVRLSVGIEDSQDLLNDILNALD